MKRINNILNTIYGLLVVFYLLDSLSTFEIKSQVIKTFIYFGFLFGTPVILIWNLFFIEKKAKRIFLTVFPTIILSLIIIVGPMKILFSTGAWRTQTILYQNRHLSFKTVEFQMRNLGARGYNKQTVEVFYLTSFFMIISEVPNDIDKRIEWDKVDKDVNELGLKFP